MIAAANGKKTLVPENGLDFDRRWGRLNESLGKTTAGEQDRREEYLRFYGTLKLAARFSPRQFAGILLG